MERTEFIKKLSDIGGHIGEQYFDDIINHVDELLRRPISDFDIGNVVRYQGKEYEIVQCYFDLKDGAQIPSDHIVTVFRPIDRRQSPQVTTFPKETKVDYVAENIFNLDP